MATENTNPEVTDEDPPLETPPAKKLATTKTQEQHEEDPEAIKDEVKQLKIALSKANKLTAEKRQRLEELERAEEERKNATLGETEKARKEAQEARQRLADAEKKARQAEDALREERLNLAVERHAGQMGFEYPDVASRLIDRNRVEFDEETGQWDQKSIKDALERLAKEKPNLITATRGGGTPSRDAGTRRAGGRDRDREQPDFKKDLRDSGSYV